MDWIEKIFVWALRKSITISFGSADFHPNEWETIDWYDGGRKKAMAKLGKAAKICFRGVGESRPTSSVS